MYKLIYQGITDVPDYNLNNVNGNTAGTGNVLTNGYGVVYGLKTPNVYSVTNNFF